MKRLALVVAWGFLAPFVAVAAADRWQPSFGLALIIALVWAAGFAIIVAPRGRHQ